MLTILKYPIQTLLYRKVTIKQKVCILDVEVSGLLNAICLDIQMAIQPPGIYMYLYSIVNNSETHATTKVTSGA